MKKILLRIEKNKKNILLLLILALAFFFRFFNLSSTPPGLYPDEAMNANQAVTDPGRVFYPENNGREGFFIALIHLSFQLFGTSILSARIVSAFFGFSTVLGVYLLAKEFFGEKAALASSFFVSISLWHINFSRILFRAIMAPFFLTWAFYLFFKALKKKNVSLFSLSGLFFGLGFHTYISYRFSVLLLPPLFAVLYLKEKNLKNLIKFSIFFLGSCFLAGIPIGIYFLQNPSHFFGRNNVSIFTTPNPLLSLGESVIKHIGMINISGDQNWRHNIQGFPALSWPVGIFFLTGLFVSLKKTIDLIKQKWSLENLKALFLIWWIGIMFLPSVLTFEGIPHHLRSICILPAVYLLAGLGFVRFFNFLKENVNLAQSKLFIGVFVLFVGSFVFTQFSLYFFFWSNHPEVEKSFTKNYVQIGHYLNQVPESIKSYVIVNMPGTPYYGLSIPAQTSQFIERTQYDSLRATYLPIQEIDKIKPNKRLQIIIPLYPDQTLPVLKEKFPQGLIVERNNFDFFILK